MTLSNMESRSEAASAGRVKMEEVIQRNLSQTERVIAQVQSTVIADRLARGTALDFGISNGALLDEIIDVQTNAASDARARLTIKMPSGESFFLHENAVNQLSERAAVPIRYSNELLGKGAWGADLLAENFRRIYAHGNGTRYLVRAVGEEARGFLSDKYRRLDARPLLDAFIGACQESGAVPVQGFALDVRVGIRAILPIVFEPIPGECFVFGINWQNSDFGQGANTISLFLMRLWCLNGATLDEILKQVHFGKKLDDNIEFSQKTIELDTLANVSKMRDVVRYAFSDVNITRTLDAVRRANEDKIDPKAAVQMLKAKMSANEIEMAIDAYNSPDVVNLPPGNTKYRLSNAVSWISQAENISPLRRMELDRFAGELFGKITDGKAVEV